MEHRKNFPEVFEKYILRDILHYTEEEIKELGFDEYQYALTYALETYTRRDILYIMVKIFDTKGKKTPKGGKKMVIKHPDIEKYIEDAYKVR